MRQSIVAVAVAVAVAAAVETYAADEACCYLSEALRPGQTTVAHAPPRSRAPASVVSGHGSGAARPDEGHRAVSEGARCPTRGRASEASQMSS